METFLKKGVLYLISCIALQMFTLQPTQAYPGASISFETFYHELSPYGTWVQDRDYGYVWVPEVRRDFVPYVSEGHWVMTEYGNTWVSDYSWGWAPFHYGRWHYDDYYGWLWIPGTEWGPAWVAWRSGGGYYGWAPLGPGIDINVSINIGRYIPDHHWVFVRQGYIGHSGIYRYCVPRRNVVNIVHHTTIINNTYVYQNRHTYYTGPRVHEIERVTSRRVHVHRINRMDRPGATVVRQGALNVYRPTIKNEGRAYAPASYRTREASSYSRSRSASPGTSQRQTITRGGEQRTSVRESNQRAEERRVTRPDNSPATRERTTTRTREVPATRSREHTPYQTRENASSRSRESATERRSTPTGTTDRSARSQSSTSRKAPSDRASQSRTRQSEGATSVRSSSSKQPAARQANPAGRSSSRRGNQ